VPSRRIRRMRTYTSQSFELPYDWILIPIRVMLCFKKLLHIVSIVQYSAVVPIIYQELVRIIAANDHWGTNEEMPRFF
jgi:hypothetical protein